MQIYGMISMVSRVPGQLVGFLRARRFVSMEAEEGSSSGNEGASVGSYLQWWRANRLGWWKIMCKRYKTRSKICWKLVIAKERF